MDSLPQLPESQPLKLGVDIPASFRHHRHIMPQLHQMSLLKLLATCLALFSIRAPATVLYVNVNNPAPASPYSDWSTAATNIQTAIDASTNGDLVLVTNGVYRFGGKFISGVSNRVAITRPVTVQSVSGPQATIIFGTTNRSSVRCVYLTNGAVLAGFTIANGRTAGQGPPDLSSF